MSKELMVLNKNNALEVFTGEVLDDFLKQIEEDALNFVGDIKTATGRKQIASKAYDIAKKKTEIDNIGKELVADWKKKSKLVDASRKKSRDFLDELKIKVRKPLTDYEKEEEERIQKERDLAELELAWDEAIAENNIFDREQEIKRKEEAIRKAEEERIAKEKAEQEEKERIEREKRIAQEAKEKAEKEAQEAIQRAKREKEEAELKAKKDAERARYEAEQAKIKAEQEKQAAVEKAKREAEEKAAAEKREQEEKEKREKEEAEKRARHYAHVKKINREALEDLKAIGIEEEIAKLVITAIAKKQVRNMSVNY